MSLPYDITTEQVNKDMCIPFPVFYHNQLFLYVSIYSYFVKKSLRNGILRKFSNASICC